MNNLLVAFLGNEEILLLCCDDGDVIAYFTSQIQSAIDRRPEADCAEMRNGDDVKHFFLANVRDSAWGLAVHSQSRKIAVSANTHEATVFAFALVDNNSDSSSDDVVMSAMDDDVVEVDAFEAPLEKSGSAPMSPLCRTRDQRIVLKGMHDNLPCIAFCNTGEDPEGRFFAVGDILGVKWTWDLHELRAAEFARLEFCNSTVAGARSNCPCDSLRRKFPHSIWGLHWLDKRTFRSFPEDEMQKTVGPLQDGSRPVDVSFQRSLVPDASPTFLKNRLPGKGGPATAPEQAGSNSDSFAATAVVDAANADDEYDDDDDEPTSSDEETEPIISMLHGDILRSR